MEYLPINDLPNELLEMIFDHLNEEELKDASLVCRRWSDLTFLGRRMDRVMLVPDFPWDNDLLQSKRKYRHLQLGNTEKCSAHVKELFQAFNFSSLRIEDKYKCISHSSLRSILLEVPNLKQLSIVREPDQMNEMIEPLPVMRKLERLEIKYNPPQRALPWHTIAPSLQGLKTCCDSEDLLKQWGLLSGQLKQVYAIFHKENLSSSFCEMTFPLLEELSIISFNDRGRYEHEAFVQPHFLLMRHKFFRRNASLRRLCLANIYLSKTLVQDITNHTKKLTSFEIRGINRVNIHANGEPGSLESLAQLTELKHLRLTNLNTYIFRGSEALTSLQSLYIDKTKFGNEGPLGFLEDLLKIAPQLMCLELGSVVMPARAVHLICNKFIKLTRLQMTYSEVVSREGLSGIDRLLHLCYLELNLIDTKHIFIRMIPKNKVRYLTLHLDYKYEEDDLLRLPEIFPQLDRLNLINREECFRESTVVRLRQLLPTCAIKIYGQLITNAGMKRFVRKWTGSEMMPVWEKEWVW